MIKIACLAPHIDHGIDGRAAAKDFAARIANRSAVEAGLRFGLVTPIGARVGDGVKIADGNINPEVVIFVARFKQYD